MKRKDPAIERLRSIAVFSTCDDAELALVASRSWEHHATAGDVLTRQGALGREFIVIVEGTAEAFVGGRPIARLGPGDFVGEIALLDPGPRTATVVAETDVLAVVSNPREFAEMLAGAPNLTRELLAGLARRLRAADVCLTA